MGDGEAEEFKKGQVRLSDALGRSLGLTVAARWINVSISRLNLPLLPGALLLGMHPDIGDVLQCHERGTRRAADRVVWRPKKQELEYFLTS
jgi:hypothetical protein